MQAVVNMEGAIGIARCDILSVSAVFGGKDVQSAVSESVTMRDCGPESAMLETTRRVHRVIACLILNIFVL